MRFFLAGIDVAKGTLEDDVSDAHPYYELGWEAVTTHFDAKHLKKEGAIDAIRDTIVTCEGREFLYRAEFSKVVAYEQFLSERNSHDEVVSLMERYAGGKIPLGYFDDQSDPQQRRYRFYSRDREIIQSIEYLPVEHLHQGQPFACFQIRRRAHGGYRNTPRKTVNRVLQALTSKYHRVFLIGRGVPEELHSSQVISVNLQTYATLISSELCHLIFGSFTGPMQLAALFSKARVCVALNYDSYDIDDLNSPIMLGRCIRYSRSHFLCVPPESIEHLLAHYRL